MQNVPNFLKNQLNLSLNSKFSGFKPHLILLFAIIIVAYWQVSFFVFGLKWDLIDVVFPFRYHFSECVQNGFFPFWDPYQQTGVPFYTDLQAPVYYPELLLISLGTGYNIYIMHILFIIYLCISGFSAFKLSSFLNKNITSSFFAGVCYSLSGYFVAHGQHFFLLVGSAWFPLVIYYYFKFTQSLNITDVVKCAISTFLLFTGGYQAISIFIVYFLVVFCIFFSIKKIRTESIGSAFSYLKYNAIYLAMVTLLCLPLLLSVIQAFSSVNRLEQGVNMSEALASGIGLKSLISFIFPFSTLKYPDFFGIDVSLRNSYFGLIPLVLFVIAVAKKKTSLEWMLLALGSLVFLSSLGGIIPLRALMFKYLPFMNLYSTTGYVRIIGILIFTLLAANYLAKIQTSFKSERKKILYVTLLLILLILGINSYILHKIDFQHLSTVISSWKLKQIMNELTFHEHIIIQSVIQLFVCSGLVYLLLKPISQQRLSRFIVIITIVEMLLANQLNIGFTTLDIEQKPSQMNDGLALLPSGFPLPVNDKVIFNDEQHAAFSPFWRNTYIFSKQVSFTSFSSFELKTHSLLDDTYPNLRSAVLDNHLCYFSDKILPISELSKSKIIDQTNILYLADSVYEKHKNLPVRSDSSDKIQIINFTPNQVAIKTATNSNQFFTILQSNFAGWKAYVDKQEVSILTSNFLYKTIFLPKGNHEIQFIYDNKLIFYTYFFSHVFFFLLLFGVAAFYIRNYRKSFMPFFIISSIALVLFAFGILFNHKKTLTQETSHNNQKKLWVSKQANYNITENFENPDIKVKKDSTHHFSGKYCLKTDSIAEFPLGYEINFNTDIYRKDVTLKFSAQVLPFSYNQSLIVSELVRNGKSLDWHCCRIEQQIERLYNWNEILYIRNIHNIQPNDILKVYFWNNRKSTCFIDDINLKLYPN